MTLPPAPCDPDEASTDSACRPPPAVKGVSHVRSFSNPSRCYTQGRRHLDTLHPSRRDAKAGSAEYVEIRRDVTGAN
jgi:hypothetical protein